jgi:hypothetical protein
MECLGSRLDSTGRPTAMVTDERLSPYHFERMSSLLLVVLLTFSGGPPACRRRRLGGKRSGRRQSPSRAEAALSVLWWRRGLVPWPGRGRYGWAPLPCPVGPLRGSSVVTGVSWPHSPVAEEWAVQDSTCVVRIRSAIASFLRLFDIAHSCLVLAATFPPFTMVREVWPGVVVTL